LREALGVAALRHVLFVDEVLGDDDVGQRIDDCDVRAGLQLEVMVRLCVRAIHDIDLPRIDNDQSRTGTFRGTAQLPFHSRREYGVSFGGIRAYHHDHIGLFDRLEGLGPGGRAVCLAQSVAGG
jgi:hypothetical protein